MAAPTLLVAGGARDPNLERLAAAAERHGAAVRRAFVEEAREPAFSWDLATGAATLDGVALEAAAAFLRYDVFTPPIDREGLDRNVAWYAALAGWALSKAGLRVFNRGLDTRTSQKLYMLGLARECGLRIPRTLVSNVEADLRRARGPAIAKPVAGGGYAQALEQATGGAGWQDGRSPFPAIVQALLHYPEHRLYRVGGELHLFEIVSRAVDYRRRSDNSIRYLGRELPWPEVGSGILRLAELMGVDFCACDLKSDPEGGAPVFLELNTGPMFAAFDAAAGGALCAAMLGHLLAPARSEAPRTAPA